MPAQADNDFQNGGDTNAGNTNQRTKRGGTSGAVATDDGEPKLLEMGGAGAGNGADGGSGNGDESGVLVDEKTTADLLPDRINNCVPDLLVSAGDMAGGGGNLGAVGVVENEPDFSTKFAPAFSTKSEPVFSTTEKPNLRLIVSTKNSPQNEAQIELIQTDNSDWKCIKGKPPYPPKHALNPSGKRQIGRRVAVGYEILRRVKCEDCEKEVRLTAGYISATQLLGLERESNEIKIGIVKNILRKKAADVDERLVGLRCTRCCLGGERGSLSAVGA